MPLMAILESLSKAQPSLTEIFETSVESELGYGTTIDAIRLMFANGYSQWLRTARYSKTMNLRPSILRHSAMSILDFPNLFWIQASVLLSNKFLRVSREPVIWNQVT